MQGKLVRKLHQNDALLSVWDQIMESGDMKKIIFSLLAIGGMFAFISCERHEWEDSSEGKKDGTKNLYKQDESHGDHKKDGEKAKEDGSAH